MLLTSFHHGKLMWFSMIKCAETLSTANYVSKYPLPTIVKKENKKKRKVKGLDMCKALD